MVSGGQDGELAARLLEDQGATVVRVHLETGFVRPDRRRALGLPEPGDDRPGHAVPPPTRFVDVRADYLREVVAGARHGYGRALDACLDCRMFLARRAVRLAGDADCDVVVTGDVVGQHPRAQSRGALDRIARASGAADRVLCPLSARRLDPTAAEVAGRVDRDRLHAAHGRGRSLQRRLGEVLDVPARSQPGGGCCLLADRGFARRLRDLLAHREIDRISSDAIDRLRVGRHFRIAHGVKAIVGRDERESAWLARDGAKVPERFEADGVPGAVVALDLDGDGCDDGARDRAAALALRYSKSRDRACAAVIRSAVGERVRTVAAPASEADLEAWRI
jgi:hypothetical protein